MLLKLRVWDAVEQKMVQVTRWNCMYPSGTEVNGSNIVGIVESLMRWTGAKDKNGTDIYEGDILMDEYNRVLLTEWRRYGFCFKAVTETNFVYAYDIMQWFEGGTLLPLIIGNIYENPEILE